LLLIDESYSKFLLFRRALAENQVSLLQNIVIFINCNWVVTRWQ